MGTGTELVTTSFEPQNMGALEVLANRLADSNLLPPSLQKHPENIILVVMTGRELGLSVMQSLRGLDVIEGRPALAAGTMVGLIKQSSVCEYFRLVSSDNESATFETKRRGEPEPTRMTYTYAEAKASGVTQGREGEKKNWRAARPDMLRARCSSKLGRAVYQDIVAGLYDPDEIEEANSHGGNPPPPPPPPPEPPRVTATVVKPPPPPPPAPVAPAPANAPVVEPTAAPATAVAAETPAQEGFLEAQIERAEATVLGADAGADRVTIMGGLDADIERIKNADTLRNLIKAGKAIHGKYVEGSPEKARLTEAYAARKAAFDSSARGQA